MESVLLYALSGIFMGWSVGTNDASNVFGTAVSTKVIKYRTAIIICSIAVVAGAVISGHTVMGKLGDYAAANSVTTGSAAFFIMLVSGLTVTCMTIIKMPVSTSQCLVGSIVGWGLSQGMSDLSKTSTFFSAWVLTPVGTMAVCFTLCFVMERFVEKRIKHLVGYDMFIKIGYLVSGIFGAYSLGANSSANATAVYLHAGIFEKTAQSLSRSLSAASIPFTVTVPFLAALIGGLSIALGVLTFSKRVMLTVGEGISKLSPLTGFLVVMSCSIIVFVSSLAGFPVSTSQAVVGAVMGAGLAKKDRGVDVKVLGRIFIAWFGTPTVAGVISFLIGHLFYKR